MSCLNNIRGLQLCLHFYVADNNDFFAPNNSIAVFTPQTNGPSFTSRAGLSWLPDNNASAELNPSNIVDGLLYPYNRSLPLYHCPADLSHLDALAGSAESHLRWRSYNMSQSINGYPQGNPEYYNIIPAWTKFTEVRHPRPSDLFVFIDESAKTISDAEFGNPPVGSPDFWQNEWWDVPSDRHMRGANLSFVDGHVEHWKWVYPKAGDNLGDDVLPQEMPDYQRIQSVMKQPADD